MSAWWLETDSFVDLQSIVREPSDGYPFLAKVKVDPVILERKIWSWGIAAIS